MAKKRPTKKKPQVGKKTRKLAARKSAPRKASRRKPPKPAGNDVAMLGGDGGPGEPPDENLA